MENCDSPYYPGMNFTYEYRREIIDVGINDNTCFIVLNNFKNFKDELKKIEKSTYNIFNTPLIIRYMKKLTTDEGLRAGIRHNKIQYKIEHYIIEELKNQFEDYMKIIIDKDLFKILDMVGIIRKIDYEEYPEEYRPGEVYIKINKERIYDKNIENEIKLIELAEV